MRAGQLGRNVERPHPVERNLPQIARIIEDAHGPPATRGEDAERVAARMLGAGNDTKYLVSRIGGHLQTLGARTCHEKPRCTTCPVRKFCQTWNEKTPKQRTTGYRVLELFCGAGGMSLGFEAAGFHPSLAIDSNVDAIDTYRANRPHLDPRKARAGLVQDLLADGQELPGRIDGIIGGPPCQTFSYVGYRTKKLDDRALKIDGDARTWLPVTMALAAAELRPKFVVMENVGGFGSALGGRVRKAVLETLDDAGYEVRETKVWAEHHGVPQSRGRYVLIALLRSWFGGDKPAAKALDDLVKAIHAKERPEIPCGPALEGIAAFGEVQAGQGSEYRRAGTRETWNHYARSHNELDLQIYSLLRQGETALQLDEREPGLIPYSLSSFRDKYRRLDAAKPAPTIPAHLRKDANSFVHPTLDRGLTPREAATLQGFPEDYMFVGEQSSAFVQIGNAVPPPVAQDIATAVRAALEERRRQRRRATVKRYRKKRKQKA